jgi:hypothetical protein
MHFSVILLVDLLCAGAPGYERDLRSISKEICWMGDRGDSFGDKDIYCAVRR